MGENMNDQFGQISESDFELLPISEAGLRIASSMNVSADIHKDDFIYHFVAQKWKGDRERAIINYFELGKYSAGLAGEALEHVVSIKKVLKINWSPKRILDFASGYGCVSRHLRLALPNSEIATCDIHSAAVSFNEKVLGLRSYLSSVTPEKLALPEHDAVFAMSFFSHMPNATYIRWLQALARLLAPGGALIFTANGYATDKLGITGVRVGENGFGFLPRSEQRDLDENQYGITISYPRWVFHALEQIPELRLSRFQEAHWWAVQDTYLCIRR
jgi:2-polyprenyl-3-methyl-5-hydroxy-6-metoxy-1,4-benzoquinol methylase